MFKPFKMTHNLIPPKEYSIYPGEYIPMCGVNALLNELKLTGSNSTTQPLVNMDECKDCFRIHVVVPGARRENIITHVENNILSIVVLNRSTEEFNIEKPQIHEFNTECLQRHILLPDSADTEFVRAEYKQGILTIYIPKAHGPSKN